MPRSVLAPDCLHPAIAHKVGLPEKHTLAEVQAAIAAHDVVIVGMGINPHPGEARRALAKAGVPFHNLSYGSYLSGWRERLALKMWSGWPTFPMIFVKGRLVGGASDLIALIDKGELKTLLAAAR